MLAPAALRGFLDRVQIVFRDPFASLGPRLPVSDQETEGAFLHRRVPTDGRRDMAVALLERVGQEPEATGRDRPQFFGGQRQRICIARALAASPQIIVADEAVSALDVSIARRITDLMRDLQDRGPSLSRSFRTTSRWSSG